MLQFGRRHASGKAFLGEKELQRLVLVADRHIDVSEMDLRENFLAFVPQLDRAEELGRELSPEQRNYLKRTVNKVGRETGTIAENHPSTARSKAPRSIPPPTRIARLPEWFGAPTTPSCSIRSTSEAALL